MTKIETVYLIHHSHTDVGYTHDQPILWDLYQRFLDEALELADKSADSHSDGAFRWTVENTAPLARWLQHASDRQIERFIALERAGRIEVTGMFANLTPLFDTDQLLESFQILRTLRQEYGFDIRYAMNCDVNGHNWPLVDLLLDLGIEGFTMAINTHFGGAPLQRPNTFWWQGPSGRKILAWNGWPYDTGLRYGIGRDPELFEETWWPRIEQYLEQINYDLPILMMQSYHPFGDNGSAFDGYSRFIDEWNEAGKTPHLCFATPRIWWAAVKEHAEHLPTFRGDWTDYWNFGCISSAREQAINRASRTRLRAADALAAVVQNGDRDAWTSRSFARYRDEAWRMLHLWDEHTWGADCSIRLSGSEDTASQWYHKANYAYMARSLSLLLQRDALADFSRQVERADPLDILVFNPLPWSRTMSGQVPVGVRRPRGLPDDGTAGRHYQDRITDVHYLLQPLQPDSEVADVALALPPVEVPGFGYAVVPRSEVLDLAASAVDEAETVENERFRLTFDTERGGIRSLYDKELMREWVDQNAAVPLFSFIHEEVADRTHPWPRHLLFHMAWKSDQVERPDGWKPDWPARRDGPSTVTSHQVYHTPLGEWVVQQLQAPGAVGELIQSVFLPNLADYIECEAWWEMGLDDHPEATYLLFPFNVPDATARLDVGGQPIVPGADQIPGTCHDYYTAQGWVDFANGEVGVTVALPENPMVQLGDFHFADHQQSVELERAMLLGWVTNNYWETNFRAHQPGRVTARYRIRPYTGPFDEVAAHRFGLEAAYAQPLLQHMGEERMGDEPPDSAPLPASGQLLELPGADSPILTLHVKAAEEQPGLILRLLNANDESQEATIGSGLLQITSAHLCDLLEQPQSAINVEDGRLRLECPPRRVTTILLEVMRA